jgi:hypothetical protein
MVLVGKRIVMLSGKFVATVARVLYVGVDIERYSK